MSAAGKAQDFIEHCKEHGWDTKWKQRDKWEFVEVTATRGSERLVIAWQSGPTGAGQLDNPPEYFFNGVLSKLHSAAVARRTIAATKPDLDMHRRRQRKAALQTSSTGDPVDVSNVVSQLEIALPFDLDNDPDSVILKAIRGNTIVWRNSYTNEDESEFVPWRISDKRGIRVFNTDTTNVFYLAQANSGRDYLSFMDVNGRFRAVALEALIGVI